MNTVEDSVACGRELAAQLDGLGEKYGDAAVGVAFMRVAAALAVANCADEESFVRLAAAYWKQADTCKRDVIAALVPGDKA